MTLTIVIACVNLWNRFTRPCLASIKTNHPCRVVLVDNVPPTKPVTRHRNWSARRSPAHRRYERNIGTAAAWNWGIADGFEKGARNVLVLNNDIFSCTPSASTAL